MKLNLQELSQQIHENAKAKGFYDNASDKNFITHQVLEIIKEIGEMHEAYKKGRFAAKLNDNETIESFEADIKDTFEDEMADVVIRMLDFMRYNEFEILQPIVFPQEISIADSKYWLSKECFKMINAALEIEVNFCSDIVSHIYTIAKMLDIDLDKHIRAKMAYNATRERLHGKKF